MPSKLDINVSVLNGKIAEVHSGSLIEETLSNSHLWLLLVKNIFNKAVLSTITRCAWRQMLPPSTL